jgi:hypothetical protein
MRPILPSLLLLLWTSEPSALVAAEDPTFALEVPSGLTSCGAFQDGRSLAAERELKCRLTLREGRWDLPGSAATVPLDLISSVELGPEARPGTPVTSGLVRVSSEPSSWEEGVVYYRFAFEQDWEVDGVPLRLRDYGGIWFRTTNGVPDPAERRIDEDLLSRGSLLSGHVGLPPDDAARTIRFSSCAYPILPLWQISVSLEGGHRALLHERHEVPLAGSGPAQLVRGELWLGAAHVVETSYWRLVYAAEHHNWNEKYWIVFDAPIVWDGGEEVRGFFVQEGFLDLPRRAALLGKDLQEVRELVILKYDQVPAGEVPPPAFKRGDVSVDGRLDISDPVRILSYLFLGAPAPACLQAADVDDDAEVSIVDAVALLAFLFLEGGPPSLPFPYCGDDPSPDELEACEAGC